MSEIPDNSIHLVITSPMYYGAPAWTEFIKKYSLEKEDKKEEFKIFHKYLYPVWEESYRVLVPGGKLVINVMDIDGKADLYGRWMNSTEITVKCQDIGFVVREDIIWMKFLQHKSPCGSYPKPFGVVWTNLYEHNLVFQKIGSRDYSNMDPEIKKESLLGKREWEWLRENFWKMQSASAKREQHVAPFPLELPKRFIKLLTYKNDIVLDPFLGSGTTMLAARQLRRNCVGYEINNSYLPIILEKTGSKQRLFGVNEADTFLVYNNGIKKWSV